MSDGSDASFPSRSSQPHGDPETNAHGMGPDGTKQSERGSGAKPVFMAKFTKNRGRRNKDLLSHLLMRSLVDPCSCPDQGSNPQPRCIGMTLYPTELPPGPTVALAFCSTQIKLLTPSY